MINQIQTANECYCNACYSILSQAKSKQQHRNCFWRQGGKNEREKLPDTDQEGVQSPIETLRRPGKKETTVVLNVFNML